MTFAYELIKSEIIRIRIIKLINIAYQISV